MGSRPSIDDTLHIMLVGRLLFQRRDTHGRPENRGFMQLLLLFSFYIMLGARRLW